MRYNTQHNHVQHNSTQKNSKNALVSVTVLSIMILSTKTLNITTLSIITHGLINLILLRIEIPQLCNLLKLNLILIYTEKSQINYEAEKCDTQCNSTQHNVTHSIRIYWLSFMLGVTIKSIVLNAVMLNVAAR